MSDVSDLEGGESALNLKVNMKGLNSRKKNHESKKYY